MICPGCGATISTPRDVIVTVEMRVTCPGDVVEEDMGSPVLSVMFWDQQLLERSVIAIDCKCGQSLHDSEDWRKSMNLLLSFKTEWIDD